MKKIIIILLLISVVKCFADEQRYCTSFSSKNRLFEFKLTEVKHDSILLNNQYCQTIEEIKWSLINQKTKETIYEIQTFATDKTAYVSNDGEYVVIINDWPSVSPDDRLEMVSIYRNGTLVKGFKLSELVNCGYNVSSSVSHFNWMFDDFDVSFEKGIITFVTLELNEIKIDISNGKIFREKNHNILESSILVYGKIIKTKGNNYTLEICHKAFGNFSGNEIEFTTKKKFRKNDYFSVLLNDSKEVNIRYGKQNLNNILFNACLKEPEKIKGNYLDYGKINCH